MLQINNIKFSYGIAGVVFLFLVFLFTLAGSSVGASGVEAPDAKARISQSYPLDVDGSKTSNCNTNCNNCRIIKRPNTNIITGRKKHMTLERTLSIIKPDAVAKNVIGEIIARFEKNGLVVVAAKMLHLTQTQAENFYAVHKSKPFYQDLVKFMTSGPVLVQVLEGNNAILENRRIMGATNPKQAAPGTIRADFATSIDMNAVHGSDAPETAATEISFFFKPQEIYSR